MKLSVFISTRALLLTCNFMLMSCGVLLVITGFLLLCDWPRILISRLVLPIVGSQSLPQPPLYYAALVLLGTGLIICSAAVLGCWSACVFNYCILTIAFLLVILLFLSECIIFGMVWLWPGCIGLSVSPTYLARTLQRTYGKSGFEQYTAAVDFAQTNLKCCGITSSTEFNASLWKLQKLSQQLNVPLSCCVLNNSYDPNAYMKPIAANQTRCQSFDSKINNGFRHKDGCIKKLQYWYHQQYTIFLSIGLFMIFVEFCVLLGILLACTRVNKYRTPSGHGSERHSVNGEDTLQRKIAENIYENERSPGSRFRPNNDAYTLSRSFRQNYRINNNTMERSNKL